MTGAPVRRLPVRTRPPGQSRNPASEVFVRMLFKSADIRRIVELCNTDMPVTALDIGPEYEPVCFCFRG